MTSIHNVWKKFYNSKEVHGQTLVLHPDQLHIPTDQKQSASYRRIQSVNSTDMRQLAIQLRKGWSHTLLGTGVPALNPDGSAMLNSAGSPMFCLADGNHRGFIQKEKVKKGEKNMDLIGIRVIMYFGWDMCDPNDRLTLWKIGASKNEDSMHRCKETYGDILLSILENRDTLKEINPRKKPSNTDIASVMGRQVSSIHWLFAVLDTIPGLIDLIGEDCREHGSSSFLNKRSLLELRTEEKNIMQGLPLKVQKEIFDWVRDRSHEEMKLTTMVSCRNAYIHAAFRREQAMKVINKSGDLKNKETREIFQERLETLIPNILSVVTGSGRAGGAPSACHPDMTVEEMTNYLNPPKRKADIASPSKGALLSKDERYILVNESFVTWPDHMAPDSVDIFCCDTPYGDNGWAHKTIEKFCTTMFSLGKKNW